MNALWLTTLPQPVTVTAVGAANQAHVLSMQQVQTTLPGCNMICGVVTCVQVLTGAKGLLTQHKVHYIMAECNTGMLTLLKDACLVERLAISSARAMP